MCVPGEGIHIKISAFSQIGILKRMPRKKSRNKEHTENILFQKEWTPH